MNDGSYRCPKASHHASLAKGKVPMREWYDGKRVYHDYVLNEPLPAPVHVTVKLPVFDWYMVFTCAFVIAASINLGFGFGWMVRDNLSRWLNLAVGYVVWLVRSGVGL